MADLDIGNLLTDTFDAERVRLGYIDGADTKFFALLQEINEHWETAESKIETTAGTVYTYGKNHNNFVEGKIAISRPEIALLHGFKSSMAEKSWVVKGTDESGSVVNSTITFKGKLPIIDKQSVLKQGYIFKIRIRVTDQNVVVS